MRRASVLEGDPGAELDGARAVARPSDPAEVGATLGGVRRAKCHPVWRICRRSADLQVGLFVDHKILQDREIFVDGPRSAQVVHLAGRVAVSHVRRQYEGRSTIKFGDVVDDGKSTGTPPTTPPTAPPLSKKK